MQCESPLWSGKEANGDAPLMELCLAENRGHRGGVVAGHHQQRSSHAALFSTTADAVATQLNSRSQSILSDGSTSVGLPRCITPCNSTTDPLQYSEEAGGALFGLTTHTPLFASQCTNASLSTAPGGLLSSSTGGFGGTDNGLARMQLVEPQGSEHRAAAQGGGQDAEWRRRPWAAAAASVKSKVSVSESVSRGAGASWRQERAAGRQMVTSEAEEMLNESALEAALLMASL